MKKSTTRYWRESGGDWSRLNDSLLVRGESGDVRYTYSTFGSISLVKINISTPTSTPYTNERNAHLITTYYTYEGEQV